MDLSSLQALWRQRGLPAGLLAPRTTSDALPAPHCKVLTLGLLRRQDFSRGEFWGQDTTTQPLGQLLTQTIPHPDHTLLDGF